MDAFFTLDKDVFVGQAPARGPWSAAHCHAGPVAGLMARAVEQAVGAEKELTRLTIDLLRPVPMAGVRVTAEVTRNGRRVGTATATVTDLNGRVCATASSMHIAPNQMGEVPTSAVPPPLFAEAIPGKFPVVGVLHDRPMFSHFAEIMYPPGETNSLGPTTLWMKTVPLLASEPTSPFQQLCPLADCGNGISRNGELQAYSFVNTDLTVTAYRRPTSSWLASQSISHWDSAGIGLSRAALYDETGIVGVALQTMVLSLA